MAENKFVKEHKIILENRNNLQITGVNEVVSFSETQVVLNTLNTCLVISGQQLKTQKLDVENGLLNLEGLISCIKYNEKKEKQNLLKRIFK